MVRVPKTIQKIAELMLAGGASASDWEDFLDELRCGEVSNFSEYKKAFDETGAGSDG